MKTAPVTPESYRSHRNLPMIAGLCSLREAMAPGMSVEDCVARLKRLHYAFKRLHEIWIARLTAEPAYELKMAFSLHSYYAAEHVAGLRKRVGEMREPPLGLDAVPDAARMTLANARCRFLVWYNQQDARRHDCFTSTLKYLW